MESWKTPTPPIVIPDQEPICHENAKVLTPSEISFRGSFELQDDIGNIVHNYPNEAEDDEARLKLEMAQAMQQLSEQANQLKVAQETISKQKEQLIGAAKFVIEHQKHVTNKELQSRQENKTNTELLEQAISDLENEKMLRIKSEVNVEKLKTTLANANDILSSFIEIMNDFTVDGMEEEIWDLNLLEHPNEMTEDILSALSSNVHIRVNNIMRNQRERQRESTEINVLTEKVLLTLETLHEKRKSCPVTLPERSLFLAEASHPPGCTEKSTGKRKRSDSIQDKPSSKKVLRSSPRDDEDSKKHNSEEQTNSDTATSEKAHELYENKGEKSYEPTSHGFSQSNRCICGYSSSNKENVRMHINRSSTIPKFKCDMCDRKFVYVSDLRLHYQSAHKADWTLSNGCRLCGKCFSHRTSLIAHHKAMHSKNTNTAVLNIENQSTNGETIAIWNRSERLRNRRMPVNVENSELSEAQQPERHGRDYTTPRHTYHCLCGKRYNTYAAFQGHVRSTRSRPIFRCAMCPKVFKVHGHLKKHVAAAHKKKYENGKYGCTKCGQTFRTWDGHKNHVKTCSGVTQQNQILSPKMDSSPLQKNPISKKSRHKNNMAHGVAPSDLSRSQCVCGNKFVDNSCLRKHIQRNSDDPKFHCNKCSMSFVYGYQLKHHYLTVHKFVWKYFTGCRLCGETFSDMKMFAAHKSTAHPTPMGRARDITNQTIQTTPPSSKNHQNMEKSSIDYEQSATKRHSKAPNSPPNAIQVEKTN